VGRISVLVCRWKERQAGFQRKRQSIKKKPKGKNPRGFLKCAYHLAVQKRNAPQTSCGIKKGFFKAGHKQPAEQANDEDCDDD